jgi:PHP family Zn ribbon phosphoesterase
MSFYADLHLHSRYARATSRNADLGELAWWARRKGITVLGTGVRYPLPSTVDEGVRRLLLMPDEIDCIF